MAKVRCRVKIISPGGSEKVQGKLAIGDSMAVTLGNVDHLVEVREDGLFYVDGEPYSKTGPFESPKGYKIKPEVEFTVPPRRIHPKGHLCRYCVHWSGKTGKERYYEEVRLTCNSKCDMTKAIADQVTKDYGVPPIDPNDLGYCAVHDSLEAGAAQGCSSHKPVSITERAVRMREKYLGRRDRDDG